MLRKPLLIVALVLSLTMATATQASSFTEQLSSILTNLQSLLSSLTTTGGLAQVSCATPLTVSSNLPTTAYQGDTFTFQASSNVPGASFSQRFWKPGEAAGFVSDPSWPRVGQTGSETRVLDQVGDYRVAVTARDSACNRTASTGVKTLTVLPKPQGPVGGPSGTPLNNPSFITSERYGVAYGGGQILPLPNGKFIFVGNYVSETDGMNYVAVAKFNYDFTLDRSYNQNSSHPGYFSGRDIGNNFVFMPYLATTHPDGGVVLAGKTGPGVGSGANLPTLMKLKADGTLDTNFGSGSNIPGTKPLLANYNQAIGNLGLKGLTVDSTGKILVSISDYCHGICSNVSGFFQPVVVRLNSNGEPDSTFGDAGLVLIPNPLPIWQYDELFDDVKVLPDGRVLLAGWGNYYSKATLPRDPREVKMALVRLNSDGSVDTTFGTGGRLYKSAPTALYGIKMAFGHHLAIQPDGKILVQGYSTLFPETIRYQNVATIWRFNPDFTLDPSFGSGGVFYADYDHTDDWSIQGYDRVSGLPATFSLQSDGKILMVMGESGISRINANGTLDVTFNVSGPRPGTVGRNIIGPDVRNSPYSPYSRPLFLFAQFDSCTNNILVSGYHPSTIPYDAGRSQKNLLLRINPDGSGLPTTWSNQCR